jgi:hypothetical protein
MECMAFFVGVAGRLNDLWCLGEKKTKTKKKTQKASFFSRNMPFCTENGHFAKTGSGQTYTGKHSKQGRVFVE